MLLGLQESQRFGAHDILQLCFRPPTSSENVAKVLRLLLTGGPPVASFAQGQPSPSVFREEGGESSSQKVHPARRGHRLSSTELRLMSVMSAAGKKGDWQLVSQEFRGYSGSAAPVYVAAMQAAYRCSKYVEASQMYDKLRKFPGENLDTVALHVALKIFGKLRDVGRSKEIWSEAKDRACVDKFLAGARIDAAADVGDITSVAAVMDYMDRHGLSIETIVFNSAINACKNMEPPSHSAAEYMYGKMLERGLQPDVGTFANLVRAHRQAPLEKIQQIRADMRDRGITPNRMFAESYLASIFARQHTPPLKSKLAAVLASLGEDRRQDLRRALDEFESANATTFLCRDVHKALNTLSTTS